MAYISWKDKTLEYEEIHPLTNSYPNYTVIFLHEALGSISQFKTFPKKLCEQLGIDGLVYNRQGHGNSSPLAHPRTAKYLHNYAFEELHALIKEVCRTKKIILVGHSDGGSISLLHASKSAYQIEGCVTIAAHVINEAVTIAGIHSAVKAYKAGKLKKLEHYHREQTDTLIQAWYETWLSESFSTWNITKELSSITCPVLAIQGEKDQYGTEEQLQLMGKYIKNCTVKMLPDCGHHPHLENEEVLLKHIENWALSHLTKSHSFSVDSDGMN